MNQRQDEMAKFSPITHALRVAFLGLRWLTPMQWASRVWPLLKARGAITDDEMQPKEFHLRRMRAIERYLLAWLAFEIVSILLTLLIQPIPTLSIALSVIASLRILEVMQVTISIALFDALTRMEAVVSRSRMVTLAGVNYLELIVCFGLIYAAAGATSLKGFGSPLSSFYFSALTQLTISYGDITPVGWTKLVAATQALFGLILVLVALGRYISSLGPMRDMLDEFRRQPDGKQD